MQKEILNTAEAAEFLGVKRTQLYFLTRKRLIPFSKPGGKMCFFRKDDLIQWASQNPIATKAEIEERVARR